MWKTRKETSRKTRPAIAGLNTFCPRPPKVSLATQMAKAAPMKTTHQGVVAGRFIASRRPVTTAEKSPTVEVFFSRYRVIRYSSNTQEATLTPSTSSSPQP